MFFQDPLYIPFLVLFTLRFFEYSIFLRKVPKRTMAVVRFQLRGVLNSNSKSNSCCCCCFYCQIMYLRKTKAYATYIYPPFDAIILLGRKTHKDKCIKKRGSQDPWKHGKYCLMLKIRMQKFEYCIYRECAYSGVAAFISKFQTFLNKSGQKIWKSNLFY